MTLLIMNIILLNKLTMMNRHLNTVYNRANRRVPDLPNNKQQQIENVKVGLSKLKRNMHKIRHKLTNA